VWCFAGTLSFRELYNDIESWGKMERVDHPVSGQNRWLVIFIIETEFFISIKFIKDAGNLILDAPTPIYIWLPWLTISSIVLCYYLYLRFKPNRS